MYLRTSYVDGLLAFLVLSDRSVLLESMHQPDAWIMLLPQRIRFETLCAVEEAYRSKHQKHISTAVPTQPARDGELANDVHLLHDDPLLRKKQSHRTGCIEPVL